MSDELELDLNPKQRAALARAESLTPERKAEIARKAAESRWTIPRATHEGPLPLGEAVIPCAVLEDGTRVLSRIGFIRAIGRKGKPKGGREYDQESKMPVFLTADNLKPFISNELINNSSPIPFRPLTGGRAAIGYRADLLPDVCHVFLDAEAAGVLQHNQRDIAKKCRILVKAFSKVGITALVDEATGYQEVRDRQALRVILRQYIGEELARWEKRFPDEFYDHIYRLKGWERKSGSTKRTHAVAQVTNDLVYNRITHGLLGELQDLNPSDDLGRRKAHHHRLLSKDVGQPALRDHFVALLALMRGAVSWGQFKMSANLALPPQRRQVKPVTELPLWQDDSTSESELPSGQSLPVPRE
jgi:hypothetical protein